MSQKILRKKNISVIGTGDIMIIYLIKQNKMKKLIDFILCDKIYFYLVVLSGAWFTYKGNYTIAFLELVLIMLLIKKDKI